METQVTLTTDKIDRLKGEHVTTNIESGEQFVVGFSATMEQVKVLVGNMNFDMVGPFREVVNGDTVEAANRDEKNQLYFFVEFH